MEIDQAAGHDTRPQASGPQSLVSTSSKQVSEPAEPKGKQTLRVRPQVSVNVQQQSAALQRAVQQQVY